MTRDQLPAHYRELFDERAAIMEYDGKLTYADANQAAMADIERIMAREEDEVIRGKIP